MEIEGCYFGLALREFWIQFLVDAFELFLRTSIFIENLLLNFVHLSLVYDCCFVSAPETNTRI